MLIVILALLALVGCGDTVENYYSISQPTVDAAVDTTTPDASPDVAVDTSEPDASQPDTCAPPDVAVDTWVADTWTAPDTYVKPDTYVAPDVKLPPETCGDGRYVIEDKGSATCKIDASGIVFDTVTGLRYTRQMHATMSFLDAGNYCKSIGFRLPVDADLAPIQDKKPGICAFPCLWETLVERNGFPNVYGYYPIVRSNGYESMNVEARFLCVK